MAYTQIGINSEGCGLPPTRLLFYRDRRGNVPVRDWPARLRARQRRAYAKCLVRLRQLSAWGHELRRPAVDYVGDGVFELRIRQGRVNYRIMYFFHGSHTAVLAEALTKEGRIPVTAVARALQRKNAFKAAPESHAHPGEVDLG